MRKVVPSAGDVRMLMMQHEKMFDAVDLDLTRTPSTLLDGAVQTRGGWRLLLVTATDMAVLCGNNGEVCWTKYGATRTAPSTATSRRFVSCSGPSTPRRASTSDTSCR